MIAARFHWHTPHNSRSRPDFAQMMLRNDVAEAGRPLLKTEPAVNHNLSTQNHAHEKNPLCRLLWSPLLVARRARHAAASHSCRTGPDPGQHLCRAGRHARARRVAIANSGTPEAPSQGANTDAHTRSNSRETVVFPTAVRDSSQAWCLACRHTGEERGAPHSDSKADTKTDARRQDHADTNSHSSSEGERPSHANSHSCSSHQREGQSDTHANAFAQHHSCSISSAESEVAAIADTRAFRIGGAGKGSETCRREKRDHASQGRTGAHAETQDCEVNSRD